MSGDGMLLRATATRAGEPDPGRLQATRSPGRPNPIGLHEARILAIDGLNVQVSDLEALDGTAVVDLKPVLRPREHAGRGWMRRIATLVVQRRAMGSAT